VLGDAKKRALYDQIRAQGTVPRGFGGGGGVYTSQGPGPGVFDLGDLFGQFFGQGQRSGGRVRVEHVDFDDEGPTVRQRSGGGRRRAPVEDPQPERKAKASDGTPLEVKGNDVYSDVRIAFDRAILGTVATVSTMDGKAEVKIPPGTSSGKKLRLRGKGMTDRAGTAGDHYITVQIDVPGHLDEDQKKQLIQLVTRLRKREQND
jgi:molecular chaperone DnaJ